MLFLPRILGETVLDAARHFPAVVLTGSQEAPLMQGVTESMAGRAAVL